MAYVFAYSGHGRLAAGFELLAAYQYHAVRSWHAPWSVSTSVAVPCTPPRLCIPLDTLLSAVRRDF